MERAYTDFKEVIHDAATHLLEHGEIVDTKSWQGKVDDKFSTLEVTNYSLTCPISPDVDILRKQINPNLPWADSQFEERISGIPYNPPPSYKSWPFWRSDSEETMEVFPGPELDERDWSYLAALIDGEGSITRPDHPRIRISQRDHKFLQSVVDKFKVGTTCSRKRGSKTGHGHNGAPHEFPGRSLIWQIQALNEVELVLNHTLPYLILKKDKAERALGVIMSMKKKIPKGTQFARKQLKSERRFSHTYPERFWPPRGFGIRYPFGNLDDVIKLLSRDPYTRQAYLPIWHPEDTGAGGSTPRRVPCTLGYYFLCREDKFNLFYPIRSCDLLRHLNDDIYLACRLLLWVLDQLHIFSKIHSNPLLKFWQSIKPGILTMHIYSLHVFQADIPVLKYRIGKGLL